MVETVFGNHLQKPALYTGCSHCPGQELTANAIYRNNGQCSPFDCTGGWMICTMKSVLQDWYSIPLRLSHSDFIPQRRKRPPVIRDDGPSDLCYDNDRWFRLPSGTLFSRNTQGNTVYIKNCHRGAFPLNGEPVSVLLYACMRHKDNSSRLASCPSL